MTIAWEMINVINLNDTKDEFIEDLWRELFSCGIKKLADNNMSYIEFKDTHGNAVKAINKKFILGCPDEKSCRDDNNLKKILVLSLFGLIKSDLLKNGDNCISIRSPIAVNSFKEEDTGCLLHKITIRYLSCKDADEEDFKANCCAVT